MLEHAMSPPSPSRQPRALMHRRSLLIGAGAAGMVFGTAMGRAYTQIATALRIAPLRLELAPGKVIDTFAYKGTVPCPALRLREGRQVSIDIRNDTDIDDIIHWHGLYVPSAADGAIEEGSNVRRRRGHRPLRRRQGDQMGTPSAAVREPAFGTKRRITF